MSDDAARGGPTAAPLFETTERLAFVALGSNVGARMDHLRAAARGLSCLPATTVVGCSSVFVTAPMGGAKYEFLNAVLALHTVCAPLPLLDVLLQLERSRGRVRDEKWGPRTLDLDVLAMFEGDALLRVHHPRLQLPHPEYARRDFVLRPLLEIAPGLRIDDARLDSLLAALPAAAHTVQARHPEPLLEDGPFGVSVPLPKGG